MRCMTRAVTILSSSFFCIFSEKRNSSQWNSTQPDGPMMLNADLILMQDFTVDPVTHQPSCTQHQQCGIGKDFGQVSYQVPLVNCKIISDAFPIIIMFRNTE